MTTLESKNENLDNNLEELLNVEMELSYLETNIELSGLQNEVKKGAKGKENPKAGKVEYLNDSKDGEYKIYSYIIEKWAFPAGVKAQAVKQLNLKTSKGIEITDRNGIKYDNLKKFEKGEKIYIRVPKETAEPRETTEISETTNSNWDNPDYFDNTKKVETDTTYQNKGIILKRDVGMSFYVMNTNDIKYYNNKPSRKATINYLREKLGALDEFAYLKNKEYNPNGDDVTNTFNIRPDFASYLKKYPNSYYIPIPMEVKKRKIEDQKFKSYAKDGINTLCKKDEPYGKYWKGLDKAKLAAFFTAIAKVETGKTTQKIGTDEYHRRETGSHNCFSFGPHHILMEGPGKRAYNALKKIGYFNTEGQTYHPKNSTMRCMGYIVEKMKDMGYKEKNIKKEIKNMLSFFQKKKVTGDDFRKFATMYNGKYYKKNRYHTKFAEAYNLVK